MFSLPMDLGCPIRRPDYDAGSLLNLIASLVVARGGKPRHSLLHALPAEPCSAARNLVFWLIDGLGYRYLTQAGRGGALADHLLGPITSVFPSTTASAITTSFTGASPAEHGLTGWHCWFPETDVLAAPLPFRRRGDEVPLTALDIRPAQLIKSESLFDALPVRRYIVSQHRIVDSDYSRHLGGDAERCGYERLNELVDQVESAVRAGSERKYIYAYYPELDTVAHVHGVASTQAASRLRAIDAAFGELLRRLEGTDTALIVSADHGFVDTPAQDALLLEDYPQLAELLVRPLSGEPRVVFCHVQPDARRTFMERAQQALGDYAEIVPGAHMIAEGWFGPGRAHPRLSERVGDVVLVMKRHATLKDRLPDEKRHPVIGNHGGPTEDEMLIPLVYARLR